MKDHGRLGQVTGRGPIFLEPGKLQGNEGALFRGWEKLSKCEADPVAVRRTHQRKVFDFFLLFLLFFFFYLLFMLILINLIFLLSSFVFLRLLLLRLLLPLRRFVSVYCGDGGSDHAIQSSLLQRVFCSLTSLSD